MSIQPSYICLSEEEREYSDYIISTLKQKAYWYWDMGERELFSSVLPPKHFFHDNIKLCFIIKPKVK